MFSDVLQLSFTDSKMIDSFSFLHIYFYITTFNPLYSFICYNGCIPLKYIFVEEESNFIVQISTVQHVLSFMFHFCAIRCEGASWGLCLPGGPTSAGGESPTGNGAPQGSLPTAGRRDGGEICYRSLCAAAATAGGHRR